MKICFISTFFTGATLPLAQHLQEKGHQCDFFLFARQGCKGLETLEFDAPIEGSQLVTLHRDNRIYAYLDKAIDITLVPYYLVKNRKYLVGYIPFFKNLNNIFKMLREIERKQYDLIYLIANEEHDAIVARELKRRGYKNIVIAYHEVVKSHTGKQELKDVVKLTSRLGYPLLCYSEHTKRKLREFIDNDNIYVTYFGPFETYKIFDTSVPIIKEEYILFIGSIQPYKGLTFLYESIRDYGKDIDTKIVVAGGGYDSCLEEMKKDDRYIVINRFLSDAEFANLTRYASCIVCPYVSGSQSGITHTAMVYGTPVVATKVGAFPEFVEEGENGCLVEYGDKQKLVDYITTIPKEKTNYVPKNIRWNNVIEELDRIISQRISRKELRRIKEVRNIGRDEDSIGCRL